VWPHLHSALLAAAGDRPVAPAGRQRPAGVRVIPDAGQLRQPDAGRLEHRDDGRVPELAEPAPGARTLQERQLRRRFHEAELRIGADASG
jgi:hypothetical protein